MTFSNHWKSLPYPLIRLQFLQINSSCICEQLLQHLIPCNDQFIFEFLNALVFVIVCWFLFFKKNLRIKMSERSRDNLEQCEAVWKELDNQQVIKDVAMKGKHITEAIKIIAKRNETSIEEAKILFFDEVFAFINNLLSNKQIHRAVHVVKNLQLNEVHYLFSFSQVRSSSRTSFRINKFFLSEMR
jgi:hypothetical protein